MGKQPELKKVLSFRAILLITINSIMGTGIFFLPAAGAMHAGPASIISWILISILAIYLGMCFAELTSMFPTSGGVYEFCKQAYGKFPSFIIGWMTIIAANITIAMLVVGAIQYLLPVPLPAVKIGISLFFVFAFNYIAYKGMKTSSFMLVTFAFITLGTLFALIIPGLFRLNFSNFDPFFVFPISSIFFTVFIIAETFFGWETATFLAEETKDAARVMPKVLIIATWVIAVIALLQVFTALGVINWQVFGQSLAPLTDLGAFHFGNFGRDAFTLLVYVSIIGSVAGWIVSAPRLILAMAKDKLFLSQFAAIHPVNNTPYKAIIFQTVLTTILVFAGSGSYNTLLQLLVPMVLIMYSAVLLSLVVLRYKKPNLKRYYKVPFGKTGPIVAVVILISLVAMWILEDPSNIKILNLGASFILVGIPIYFLLQLYHNPKAVVLVNEFLATITYYTEKIFFPTVIRKNIMVLLGDLSNKIVLEYGCSVGSLTLHLAEFVKPKGKVYATNEAKHEIEIIRERLSKRGHKHVLVYKTEPNDIHHKIPKCDAAVSVGKIGNLEKEEVLLKKLNQKMKKNARIVFLDYDKFFAVIPNIEWLSKDDEIKKLFKKAGFKVDVMRKGGRAWQYIYIYGNKFKNV